MLVMPIAHPSEWLESVFSTDGHGRDALDFCNQSGCHQFSLAHTHIAGYRLDLVMSDVPDTVDVRWYSTDHCIVSCVLRVQQSVK